MRRAPAGNPWLLVLPALFLVTVLFLSPIINMVILSLKTPQGLSIQNYTNFFLTPHLTDAMLRSVQLAAIATLISSIVSWPIAFFLAYIIPPRFRVVALLLLIAPFWTSFTIRAFSWQLVLSDNGVIAASISYIIGEPVSVGVLYTMAGSILGLTLFGTMLTTLTLFGSMTAINQNLLEASASLGAKSWSIFRDVVMPLATPGWLVGTTLTFVICVGDYAVPTLLGGGLKPVLAQLMLSTVKGTYDLPNAATMAMILMFIVFLSAIPMMLHILVRRKQP